MAQYRLAHLSDLHISEFRDWLNPIDQIESGKYTSKALAAFRALMRGGYVQAVHPSTFASDVAFHLLRALCSERYRDMFDCVVVTGDLATTGWEQDVALARDYFRGALTEAWLPLGAAPSLLEQLACPIVALPGNHDRYEGILHSPRSTAFEQYFGAGWDFDRADTYRYSDTTARVQLIVIEKGAEALVIGLADLSLQSYFDGEGHAGWIGQGKVRQELVRELVRDTRRAIAELAEKGLRATPIWAVHFPPDYEDLPADLELLDSDLLVAGAAYCNVSVILAGHTHCTRDYTLTARLPHPLFESGGVNKTREVRILCAGTATGMGPEGVFSFGSIDIETLEGSVLEVSYQQHKYENKYRTFVPA